MGIHTLSAELGFAEKTPGQLLSSGHFPSKIGGKPAWLSLINLPTQKDLQCTNCDAPLIFLCQIYAPCKDDDENFHRTIFIFICKNIQCNIRNDSKNILVLRSSLPRENDFYNYEPPDFDNAITFDYTKFGLNMCCCGCPATKHCSKCKKVFYCSKNHQITDWSNHKKHCAKNSKLESCELSHNLLYPEFEIVNVLEEDMEDTKLAVHNEVIQPNITGTMQEASEEDLLLHAGCVPEDKTFARFQEKIASGKRQVIRFDRGGEPLYIAASPRVNLIPKCEYCDGERQFEFQIMPQMLCVINEIDLDFGVIAVYTCKDSCTENKSYKVEFAFKQDVTE